MEPVTESRRVAVDETVTLAVDLITPIDPVGTFVVCHPHPLYGGSRHDMVVAAMTAGAVAVGWRAVRFDFRGAGDSTGEHGGGDPERADVVAVLDQVGDADRLVLGGYSFGADVALSIDDPRFERWVCCAPVLRVFPTFAAASDRRPKHLIAGAHDQFQPATALRGEVATWTTTDVAEIPTADHFFGGAHATVTDHVRTVLGA